MSVRFNKMVGLMHMRIVNIPEFYTTAIETEAQ